MADQNIKVDKELLNNLLSLARIDFDSYENLIKDFQAIVDYFSSLQEVETGKVVPLTESSLNRNEFRDDSYQKDLCLPKEEAIKSFPEEEGGFLKVPPVF